jgi:tetratricopeptide (TPR) repeat protein
MSDGLGTALVAWFRRYERILAFALLGAAAIAVLGFAARPVRVRALDMLQRGLDRWEGRWDERLRQGERLLAEGRTLEAVEYLEQLDRVFPATDVRHARDQQREWLLVLLARGYEALDRRTRTIETYQRLVLFDPRNYRNHFDLGRASERLLSGAFLAPEARDAYAAALAIHPVHLPSLRGYIDYYLDRSEFPPIVRAFETYQEATLVQQVEIRVGNQGVTVPVLVDGRFRDYDVALPAPIQGRAVTLTVATGGFSIALEQATLTPAIVAGAMGTSDPMALDVTRVEPRAFDRVRPQVFRAADETSTLAVPIPDTSESLARVRLRLALFKPIDRALFAGIARSYRNLLNDRGLAEAEARTVLDDSPEAADRVYNRLWWHTEGIIAGRQ